ncbi:hypothetical protein ROJ8625_01262 [Roseivivax jejudonensis]|uniref:Chromosome partition protein Smc n=1 Tax=Roseivivax jejudonensis TaxID=1529041 RepID=A0A1X6YRP7_9RHOB|nr:hypothetical protein [Roseivivax jejudonensis]SLN29291.1 hypothetical protein ROJ8625_01262 [Roseivivax jejudonensis]
MSDIDELQGRIAAALERIGKGVGQLDRPTPPPAAPEADPAELEDLRAALEDERLANAQLEERVRGIRDKQERQVAELREQVAASREALAQLDGELGRLRRANDMLRDTNEELSRAVAENVGEPHLINKAMLAELESIRAARATDKAEGAALLAALEPLLTEAAEGTAAETGAETEEDA